MEEKHIDSYKKLSVGKYLELKEVVEDKEADEYDKNIAIVSILTGVDPVAIYNLPLDDFNRLLQLSAFLMKMPEQKVMETKYKVGKYTLIPIFGPGEMTTAQFIDYQTLIKDPETNMIQLLSIFLVPEDKSYNQGYSIEDVQEEIKDNLMIEDALALSSFFFLLLKAYVKATLHSLERKMKKMKRKKMLTPEIEKKLKSQIQILEAAGDGLAL